MRMFATPILAPLFGATLLAGAATAQEEGGPDQPLTVNGLTALVEARDDDRAVPRFGMDVDEVMDATVFDANDEEVGDVEEVLVTTTGTVAAISVEVGGFLGIGDKEVILPVEELERVGDLLITDLTREEIEALPEWED